MCALLTQRVSCWFLTGQFGNGDSFCNQLPQAQWCWQVALHRCSYLEEAFVWPGLPFPSEYTTQQSSVHPWSGNSTEKWDPQKRLHCKILNSTGKEYWNSFNLCNVCETLRALWNWLFGEILSEFINWFINQVSHPFPPMALQRTISSKAREILLICRVCLLVELHRKGSTLSPSRLV